MNNAPLPWFEGMPPHRKLVVSQRAEEYTRPVLVAIDYPDQEEVSSKHRQTEDSSSFLLLIRQWHTCFRNLSEPLSNKVARQVDLLKECRLLARRRQQNGRPWMPPIHERAFCWLERNRLHLSTPKLFGQSLNREECRLTRLKNEAGFSQMHCQGRP